MSYLLDSNTLIEAKNRYYRMPVCPGYWHWVMQSHAAGSVASIVPVREELVRGNDDLAQWARDNSALFSVITDDATQAAYGEVANFVASQESAMNPGALAEFLSGADPWLVAKAISTGATVVTHERANLAIRRKYLIPNVCSHFGVAHLDTFDLLSRSNAVFVLSS